MAWWHFLVNQWQRRVSALIAPICAAAFVLFSAMWPHWYRVFQKKALGGKCPADIYMCHPVNVSAHTCLQSCPQNKVLETENPGLTTNLRNRKSMWHWNKQKVSLCLVNVMSTKGVTCWASTTKLGTNTHQDLRARRSNTFLPQLSTRTNLSVSHVSS